MNSRLRSIWRLLILLVVFAGIAAPTTQAAEFHAGEAHSIVEGKQTAKLTFTAGAGFATISCEGNSVSGTITGSTATELTLGLGFGFCKDSVGRMIDTVMNGCMYVVHATTGSGPYTGETALSCPAGKDMETRATSSSPTCTATIQPQEELGPIDFTNEAGKVKMQWTITNVKTTISGGFLTCGLANGEYTGSFTGTWLMEAKTTAGAATTLKVE
jgi:hypothetical protein